MMLPGIMAVVVPVIVGVVLGVEALGGLLSGALVTGVLMAIFMSNAGGAWDNAKKYIETGHHGGKGSEAHKAAVVGDTVGDPFKDTSGPSINILIKLMTVAPLFLSIGGLLQTSFQKNSKPILYKKALCRNLQGAFLMRQTADLYGYGIVSYL